jgi:alcohol dehydrogenase
MRAMSMSAPKIPLESQTVADPVPGPGQVRIRLAASGLCGTDVHAWEGELPVPLPIVLGHEPAGVVDLVGTGVTWPPVGERVGVSWFQDGCRHCIYCQKRQFKFCSQPKTWLTNGGSFADFMIVEAEGCVTIPEEIPWELAAPLFCGGFSAMSAYRAGRPNAGERIAVIGIGGLGHLALQVARANGHHVIALTNSASKTNDAMALGADEVLVIRDHAGKELLDAGGADVILSFSPSMKQNNEAIEGLLPDGRFVTTAVSAETIQANPVSMLFKQISIIGSAHNHRADLVDMLAYVANRQVKPMVELYPLTEINDVIQRLIAGKVRHRAVLTISN